LVVNPFTIDLLLNFFIEDMSAMSQKIFVYIRSTNS